MDLVKLFSIPIYTMTKILIILIRIVFTNNDIDTFVSINKLITTPIIKRIATLSTIFRNILSLAVRFSKNRMTEIAIMSTLA